MWFAEEDGVELFKPFIYQKPEVAGTAPLIKQVKELVEAQEAIVWDILEDVIRENPGHAQPRSHASPLGIQAFERVPVEGKAIRIDRLVCTAFNADFDGDQMAVHIPPSPEAKWKRRVDAEAAQHLRRPMAILSPFRRKTWSGIYYMTKQKPKAKGEGRVFGPPEEVVMALEADEVELLTPIASATR